MTKLTLSVEEDVVKQAKTLARQNGRSVSAMFTHYVRAMTIKKPHGPAIGPLTREASGLVTLPKGKTYREVLEDALLEKYGLEP
jgi:hypothetical protein